MSLADLDSDVIRADLVAPPDAGRRIAERVEDARRHVVRVRFITRCLLALAAGLTLWGVLTWVDYRVELPWTTRMIGLAAVVAATVVFAKRGLPQWTGAYRLEDAAGDVERRLAHFGQRLRTTVDYQDPERRPSRAEPQLVRALEDDTYSLSQQADFSVVVDSRPMLAGVGIVAVLAMAWLVTLVMSPEWRIATGRTLLLPLQYTTVTFTPAEQTIRSGESVDVVAEISGRAIHAAAVRFRPVASDGDGDGEWTTLKLVPPTTDDDPQNSADQAPAAALIGKVAATLADCQQDLEFEVVAGPVPLPLGRVRVLQPLEIKEYQAQATPPEYTGKPVEQFDNWTFKVLEGTHVALQVELSRAASEARLTPVKNKSDKSKSQDSSADPSSAMELRIDGGVLRGDLADLRTSGVWELTAKAADGIELEPQRLAIRVQPDGRAKVRFLEPAEELEVISTAEVPLVMEAADDLALVRIGIACQVANGPMKTLWQQDLAEGTTDQIRGQTTLQLEDFKLTFQDGVTYYAFADDKYFDQERRTSTPLRFIDIRPFKMAYQMLDTGGT